MERAWVNTYDVLYERMGSEGERRGAKGSEGERRGAKGSEGERRKAKERASVSERSSYIKSSGGDNLFVKAPKAVL